MFENSVIQMTTGKLVGATVLPNSILLISGIIIWRYWRNRQSELQVETDDLHAEVRQIKEQLVTLQTSNNKNQPVTTSSPSQQKHSLEDNADNNNEDFTDPEKMGLFEVLIRDNIRLRKQA